MRFCCCDCGFGCLAWLQRCECKCGLGGCGGVRLCVWLGSGGVSVNVAWVWRCDYSGDDHHLLVTNKTTALVITFLQLMSITPEYDIDFCCHGLAYTYIAFSYDIGAVWTKVSSHQSSDTGG